jgi:hypothetical protein
MNNVTYARYGDSPMNFWGTFPAEDPAWGRLPVWGFARVSRSEHPDFAVGDRFFGFMPAASHHLVLPGSASRGFVDTTADRHFPHPWYQTFQPGGEPDHRDDRRTLLRPVYPASFHTGDVVAGKSNLGGLTLLLTSASSKVAIGIAHRLRDDANVRTVGATSEHHRDFVTGLGLYDEVVGYGDLASLTADNPVVCVDLAGDNDSLATIYRTFGDNLTYTALLGWTHGVQPPPELADPTPDNFFTPAVEGTTIELEGEEAFFARYHAAEDEFLDATESWLTTTTADGPAAAAEVFRSLLDGEHPADRATILRP